MFLHNPDLTTHKTIQTTNNGHYHSINLGMVIYPAQADFNSWEKLGNPGWNWESMAPYFRKFHTYTEPPQELKEQLSLDDYMSKDAQGSDGPLHISYGSGVGYVP